MDKTEIDNIFHKITLKIFNNIYIDDKNPKT